MVSLIRTSFLCLSIFIICNLAEAKTLSELITKESAVEFGECQLSPKPKLTGEKIVVVIPARFDDPQVWVTRSLLLVGLNKENLVQEELELTLPVAVSPKEVISVACTGNKMKISSTGKQKPKIQTYKWNGIKLQ